MDQSKQKTTEQHKAALVDSMDSLAVTDNLCADLSSAEKEPIENLSRTTFSDAEENEYSLQIAQQSLKEMYLTRFRKINPLSLPFKLDIENTWVSLALKEKKEDYQVTEGHAELLKRAFDKVNMLIIEGDPATGKTSLMQRLAYEWAKGKQELLHYDLVLYAEFREVHEKNFESIVDLVLYFYSKTLLKKESYEKLELIINNEQFSEERRILVLLDGYDESSLEKQCSEINSYMNGKTIKKSLFFNTVITTRKGYLSNIKGTEGPFVFAEALGFTTWQQKEKFISNHFHSSEVDNQENISAVHNLLYNNDNLNRLAGTPLFLTFICLVHERIVDGTLLELYCNIIWWLINRHQQDFPDRDIPALFGFHNCSGDKFKTIQEYYTRFPQLLFLGKMALTKLNDNVFGESDYEQFNLKPIIEQVGLMRKQEIHNESLQLATSFFFPHRTIQEFLAAYYCFCSNDPTSEWLLPDSRLDTSEKTYWNPSAMNEFERFLLRMALSDKMPIQAEKRKYYFDRIAQITSIKLATTRFEAFKTAAGFNDELLNWFLSLCTHVQYITLTGYMDSARYESNTLNDPSLHNESTITSKRSSATLFSFIDLIKLHSLTFGCIFPANSQVSFTNCPSLKNLKFTGCVMKSSTIDGIATLPAIDIVEFYFCNIDLSTWQSITDQIGSSSVKCLKLTFNEDFNAELLVHLQQCNNVEEMEITIDECTIRQNELVSFNDLIKLRSLTFGGHDSQCIFSPNSQLSFTNCSSLKKLLLWGCIMESSTIVGFATLPASATVTFDGCRIDLETWQSITDDIRNSSINYLELSAEFFADENYPNFRDETYTDYLDHLQKCERIQKIHIIDDYVSHVGIEIFKSCVESATDNLALAAQILPALTSITICGAYGSLSERNLERIDKAGQERNPNFSIEYV